MIDMMRRLSLWSLFFATCLCTSGAAAADRSIDFNRDIRPILANSCYACHGPDKNTRKADLLLHSEESAFADRGGYQAIQPGKPQLSEVYRRITADDPKMRMPPAKFGKQLTAKQIDLIRRWIEQGAKWQKHWSRIQPVQPALPNVQDGAWPRNPVDAFVLVRLEQEGLKPDPEAEE